MPLACESDLVVLGLRIFGGNFYLLADEGLVVLEVLIALFAKWRIGAHFPYLAWVATRSQIML